MCGCKEVAPLFDRLADRSGRTPAHVAVFASNDDALRALAKTGVDINALEYEFYDVVTIAAVANDPTIVALAIDRVIALTT